ncbi:HEAT repeat domain-containing protein [Geothrix sp. PMB-07]|uniref:HEAT repeat domain-containing protein n=1 Tax=Geothrix sp. PMB-07 TaxID=3068640 RepID=UPI002741599E|nr:HEAT repeat domain-containing protein [Geothrix sp. PMB-07]WLT33036.1 HEAT repeat domain-containing protein [Geothrix sp. PMB-07]
MVRSHGDDAAMNDFLQVAQSLTVALKALQMYTAMHPRAQEGLAKAHLVLEASLLDQPRIQFIVTGAKAFVDGQVQDARIPQIASLIRLVSERGISGFSFERGLTQEEVLTFLQGMATKPAKLEEVGGLEGLLKASDVRHIKVSQTRYQEVTEGEESGAGDKAPAFSPAPPAQPPPPTSHSPENLVKFIREALLTTLAKGAGPGTTTGSASGPGFGKTGFSVGGVRSGSIGGDEDGSPGGLADEGGVGPMSGFGPADLSGLGPLGRELGLGEGMPTPGQLGTLRQVLMGLAPEVQFSLLAGLGSLPEHPAGLGLGVKALAGEILAVSTSTLLAQGLSWPQLKGPVQDILRPLPDRERLMRTLSSHLRVTGQDASQAEAILRHLAWEELSLEAKILKVLEEGHLYELSHEERLALLRELLDLRRFDDFIRIQEIMLETLSSERADLRLLSIKTLNGVARWTFDPGLPPEAEGSLAEALRAHFAWEPDPPIHRWTTEALESLLTGLICRGELGPVLADLQELEGLCAFLDEQQPWRNEALGRLRTAIQRPELLDLAVDYALSLKREDMLPEMQPYFEFIGEPMARHLTHRLGDETDRARRGRLVEAVRSLGPTALPTLLESLESPAWYLVRNALTLLSDLGAADCVPAIIPHLRNPEPRVRRTAVRALWKLGGPVAEPHLLARMKDTDVETMQEILFALGQLRSEAGLPQIEELALDKRVLERIRIQALDTLGHIASPKALPTMLECIKRKGFFGGGESQPIRLAAARAMAALGSPEALNALKKAVDGEPKGEDREAMQRLLERPVSS